MGMQLNRRSVYIAAALLIVAGAVDLIYVHTASAGQRKAAETAERQRIATKRLHDLVAAAGRVEPRSEEIKIGSELPGVIREVRVEEGDHVRRGEVLAELDNDNYKARVESTRADLALREAELRKVVNGSREQERKEAAAAIQEADAVVANTRSEMERYKALYEKGDVSRSAFEKTDREYRVAVARYDAAVEHHSFVDAPPREEDRARAEASVQLSRAALAEAEAMLAKTIIRSPINGVVLRKYHRAGEALADKSDAPIVSLGDDATLRVRVDVDEADVAHVRVGQRAYVTAEGFGDRKFWGRVVRVGEELGRKNVRTDEPTEHVDTKILETLVELDGHPPLPAGLRVDSFIVAQ